jgi:zinc/manganese transport system permease protein
VDQAFLVVVALATTLTVPVVGALLVFALMIGPAAAARCLTDAPGRALVGSVAVALVTVWTSIACSYWTTWPVGFFVGTLGAGWFVAARAVLAARRGRFGRRVDGAVPVPA